MTKPAPIVFDSTGQDGTTTATVPHAGVLGREFIAEELQRVKEEMVRSPHSLHHCRRVLLQTTVALQAKRRLLGQNVL